MNPIQSFHPSFCVTPISPASHPCPCWLGWKGVFPLVPGTAKFDCQNQPPPRPPGQMSLVMKWPYFWDNSYGGKSRNFNFLQMCRKISAGISYPLSHCQQFDFGRHRRGEWGTLVDIFHFHDISWRNKVQKVGCYYRTETNTPVWDLNFDEPKTRHPSLFGLRWGFCIRLGDPFTWLHKNCESISQEFMLSIVSFLLLSLRTSSTMKPAVWMVQLLIIGCSLCYGKCFLLLLVQSQDRRTKKISEEYEKYGRSGTITKIPGLKRPQQRCA